MLRILVLALFLPLAALAQPYPAPLSDTVSDFADLLPPEAEARVSQTIRAARAETGVHIVLVTVERISGHGGTGARIEDYARDLFNAWGVGDATRNDGILILVARADREMRIALGTAYDAVWDGRAQRVIDTAMLPEFREDRYAEGIEAGVASAVERLARPFGAGTEPPPEPFDPEAWAVPALVALFVIGWAGAAFRGGIGDGLMRFRRCPSCGARSLTRSRDVTADATEAQTGTGILHTTCRVCGYDHSTPFTVPRRSSSSNGSGDGGFGGGSSSGGGATGRW